MRFYKVGVTTPKIDFEIVVLSTAYLAREKARQAVLINAPNTHTATIKTNRAVEVSGEIISNYQPVKNAANNGQQWAWFKETKRR